MLIKQKIIIIVERKGNMTKVELNKLVALIDKADKNDLKHVKAAYKARVAAITANAKIGLSVGDKVKMTHAKIGGTKTGIIEKVNRTKVLVDIEGYSWNVPMAMVEVI